MRHCRYCDAGELALNNGEARGNSAWMPRGFAIAAVFRVGDMASILAYRMLRQS